jgi:hypothetical protein
MSKNTKLDTIIERPEQHGRLILWKEFVINILEHNFTSSTSNSISLS